VSVVLPARRALRAVLRRAERSVLTFIALVLALGAIGAAGMVAILWGSLWMQAVGVVVFLVAGGCALALSEEPAWLKPVVFLLFVAPTVAMAAVAAPRARAAFDGPTRVTLAERVMPLPLTRTGCHGVYRYTVEGERYVRYLAHSRPCLRVAPVEYVVANPRRVRRLPDAHIRYSDSPTPPPVSE